MLRSNRFVLVTALATLAIALPSGVQARPKIPGNMTSNCLTPQGTTLPHGESLVVIDDESCSTANYWCNGGTLCYVVEWDAVCGDQDFGAPHAVSECYQSPAPSRMLTPSWTTPTAPTTSTTPSGNLSWY
jgi:hypothetical protein